MQDFSHLKTAFIYDRVNTPYGGAEQVLLALQTIFPDADLFTSVYEPKQAQWAHNFTVKTSFLQKWPAAKNSHRLYLPLMPLAFEQFDLDKYQLIVSITSAEAKGVITKPNQLHLCYLLTPPRYLYSHRQQYLQSRNVFNLPGLKALANKTLDYLTWWDQAASHRPDAIIPISKLVKNRVRDYYGLETLNPIYPPIDVSLQPENKMPFNLLQKHLAIPDQFLLTVSRLVSYKRVDLAIKACQQLQKNLVIVGSGPEKRKLQAVAKNQSTRTESRIIFLDNQPQPVVNQLMSQAQAFLLPGIDDFGLSPIQANYLQTPAIINANSGAAEVMAEGVHAVYITNLSVDSVKAAILQALKTEFNQTELKNNAARLSQENFLQLFTKTLQMLL